MATNLRLSENTANALREMAQRVGRSQQDLLREAVDRYLGVGAIVSAQDSAVANGLVRPATPFIDVVPQITLDKGVTTGDLIDRDDQR